MKLEDFQTYPFKSLQEYISDKDRAVKFSFLLQGDEPDRSELTKLIYSEIFEWYNENEHSGDTLITYRTVFLESIMENHIATYLEISKMKFLMS
ncbi:hypothetical protein [Streptococcus dysgalactiae]|uniref:hypothetical protein n=1 Tax=Streptococcus dysgalactiae TaxID=1334 RepID=UPI00028BC386|nr:hypothetical protein [Streptococcus dysgalactiae]WJD53149.1 hypothetical protein QRS93_04930 [Streptococcus dysgalactiae subsp. equisimilis]BAM61081.1 hypothetical protein GGS_0934 [Streptococcus dysgalactiae subsp. equisimilis RE378]GET69328.1 hypothetical protein KNZ01_18620 [Streptococcus dysgalactiae subsp. equisimilis]GET77411.1 hypothetical protein KNZ07_19020 [Streptococcus dysgalactiae subsp. equisimilis]GET79353.1 hypothetical protein KNZ10_19230 [Streptococcus dysgalactiae subsp. 